MRRLPHSRRPPTAEAMSYWRWLVATSLVFVVVEQLFPWRKGQRVLRRGWFRDVAFLALNGHFFSL